MFSPEQDGEDLLSQWLDSIRTSLLPVLSHSHQLECSPGDDERPFLTPSVSDLSLHLLMVPSPSCLSPLQSNCRSVRANLASVQNSGEYGVIQNMVRARDAWLGGSDAQRVFTNCSCSHVFLKSMSWTLKPFKFCLPGRSLDLDWWDGLQVHTLVSWRAQQLGKPGLPDHENWRWIKPKSHNFWCLNVKIGKDLQKTTFRIALIHSFLLLLWFYIKTRRK